MVQAVVILCISITGLIFTILGKRMAEVYFVFYFSQGLLLNLPYPNTDTKNIIEKFHSLTSTNLDESIVSFLAERNKNFRLLQGSLNKIVEYVKMHDKDPRQITIEELGNVL